MLELMSEAKDVYLVMSIVTSSCPRSVTVSEPGKSNSRSHPCLSCESEAVCSLGYKAIIETIFVLFYFIFITLKSKLFPGSHWLGIDDWLDGLMWLIFEH